ncbi:MAG: SDR family oxidoreductase [Bacteroidales bacterium]|nr:SDR family oxidoreductase [Bacteroidales bacterium]
MDLQLKDRLFVVTGASSGFGKAIATTLTNEKANVIAVARGVEKLESLQKEYPGIEIISLDITLPESLDVLVKTIGKRELTGVLVNAGGPPAKAFLETVMTDWDEAYQKILRWKIDLTQTLLPYFEKNNYGRYLFIESVSVKQPVPNLVLSTSLRLAVTGFVKTFSDEIAHKGITANILAPGFHMTPALERVILKNSEVHGLSFDEAKDQMLAGVPTRKMGSLSDFASLAVWLLSPMSSYITGQTISVEGGSVRGTMG